MSKRRQNQTHRLIVDQTTPANSECLAQVGLAFRVRMASGSTVEWAVFRCERCGQNEPFRLRDVRTGKAKSCGCKRGYGLETRMQSDYILMVMRHQHGIAVEPAWRGDDEITATAAIIRDCGRNPGGMVLSMIDPARGYIAGNVMWSWYEIAERQQQSAALHRMAKNGMRWCELWAEENQRIERAKNKKINAFPIHAQIITDCLFCGTSGIKCKLQRRLIRRYYCEYCSRFLILRRPQ